MFSLVVGFILPIIAWVISIPLKIVLKLIRKGVKYGTKKAVKSMRSINKKEKEDTRLKQAGRVTKTALKVGYRTTKFGIQSSIIAMKLAYRVCVILVRSLFWLASATTLVYSLVSIGVIISLVATLVAIGTINQTETPKTEDSSNNNSSVATGVDFLAIDWSKDFSGQLNKIEDKKGVEARNWAELSIVSMNTAQRALNDNEIEYVVSGFMTGLKAVESGQTSLTGQPHITKQEVRTNGSNDTPMQFDTNWQKYNPYYTDYNRSSKGSGYYYPDAFYGILKRFSNSGTKGFLPSRTDPLYERAFKDMGVDMTPGKLKFVRYVGNITNEYNAVFLENTGYVSGLTKDSANDTVYANAMLIIQFGETYGYGVTDKTVSLAKSLYAKNVDDKYSKWFYDKTKGIQSIYGMVGGSKSYPSDVNKTSDYGVIDGDGKGVKGSLFSYLVNSMPAKAKENVWGSTGLKVYNASSGHYMRARYDLTAYLLGVYDLWWVTNELELTADFDNKGSSNEGSSSISKQITDLAKQYAEDESVDRLRFGHTGVGTKQDAPSFVNGLLRELELGVDGSSMESRPLMDGNLTYVRTLEQMEMKVKSVNEVLVEGDWGDGNIPANELYSILKPGDILLSNDKDLKKTAVYVGQNESGDYITVEINSNSNSYANMNLTGKKYEFGYTNLKDDSNSYNYVIRLDNNE